MFRRVIASIFLTLGLGMSLAACAEVDGHAPYALGTHYRLLDKPVPVQDPSKVEVREFFFYGCPHCYQAEHAIEPWLKTKPADVNYVSTPVLFLRNAEPMARAFYIAEAKGILSEIHKPLFDAIHKHREPLFSVSALANFFKKYGVDPDEFNQLYSSFGVSTRVRQADALTRDYQITGVPAFAVNGKYVILSQNLKSFDEVMKVADYLVAKERKELGM